MATPQHILSFDDARSRDSRSGAHLGALSSGDERRFLSPQPSYRQREMSSSRRSASSRPTSSRPTSSRQVPSHSVTSRPAFARESYHKSVRDLRLDPTDDDAVRHTQYSPHTHDRHNQDSRSVKDPSSGRRDTLKKKIRGAKADHQFERRIASQEHASARQDSESRAALYQMHMGRNHKRSSRMQNRDNARPSGKKVSGLSRILGLFSPTSSSFASRVVIGFCAFLFGMVLIYQPLSDYYQQVRQHQRLEAEYSVVSQYYDEVRAEVDYLNTEEGLESYIRENLGWVHSNEHMVSIDDINSSKEDAPATIASAALNTKIEAPQTWYSGLLDVIFSYRGE